MATEQRLNIPSNLSEATFRIYEHCIARGVVRWPDETSFGPSDWVDLSGRPLSGNTFAARMRDAITSVKRFGWESAVLDKEKLWTMAGKMAIAFDKDGNVWMRNKGTRGRPTGLITEARERNPNVSVGVDFSAWKNVTEQEIEAVCLLIHGGRLTGPIVIEGLLNPEVYTPYESTLNVVFHHDKPNNTTVIT